MVYEWKCKKCNNVESVERSLNNSDVPPATCSSCGYVSVATGAANFGAGATGAQKPDTNWQKLISRSSFQLRGGGWYKDGYSKTNQGD